MDSKWHFSYIEHVAILTVQSSEFSYVCIQVKTYQSERAEDRQTLHIGKPQLHQTQTNNNPIKDVPALLKVIVWIQSKDLQHHLCREDSSEHLVSTNKTLHWN